MSKATKWLPLFVTLAGTIGAAILTPAFVTAHPTPFLVVGALAQVLHAVLPSVFGASSKQ